MLNSIIFLMELMKTMKNISVGISGLRFEPRMSQIWYRRSGRYAGHRRWPKLYYGM